MRRAGHGWVGQQGRGMAGCSNVGGPLRGGAWVGGCDVGGWGMDGWTVEGRGNGGGAWRGREVRNEDPLFLIGVNLIHHFYHITEPF